MEVLNDTNAQVRIKQLENQLNLTRSLVDGLKRQVKFLNSFHKKEIDDIKGKLEEWRCLSCRERELHENGDGAVADPSPVLAVSQIGVIYTDFPEKRGTPRQPGICPDTIAKLVLNNDVFTNPHHALEGLQEFSHIWILFYFHKNESNHVHAKVSPPRLNGARTGVFSTRSPHRPSPIGLSLVKIDRIMGNTVYFNGVDMVNGTPVLDIKPYIPQYDNPNLINLTAEPTLTTTQHNRTENNNETRPEIGGLMENLNIRAMDGEENTERDQVLGAAASEPSTTRSNVDELHFTRLNSRIGEREAPDGEEEEEPPNISQTVNHIPIPTTPEGHIRVPSWIDQPPVASLTVSFKDRALAQLGQLGAEGEEKKRIISNVLREDPRSVYLRERWGSHCYVFRIAELYVSCKFNDTAHTVTVYQVFQNAAPEGGDQI